MAALAAVPNGASVLFWLNWSELGKGPLGEALGGAERELSGVGPIGSICGSDPTKKISQLVVVVAPSGADELDLGIVAVGDLPAALVLDCARAVILRRGGQPVQSRLGSFTTIRDRAGGSAEVAVREAGPVLVGKGAYLRAMAETADGLQSSIEANEVHRSMRGALGRGGELLLTVVLPPRWVETLSDDELARESPLSAVRILAARLDVGQRVRLRGLMGCTDAAACKRVGDLLRELGHGLFRDLLREVGVSDEQVRFSTHDRQVNVEIDLTPRQAGDLIGRALAVATSTPLGPPESDAGLRADEVVLPTQP
jgi:hypothetical protein